MAKPSTIFKGSSCSKKLKLKKTDKAIKDKKRVESPAKTKNGGEGIIASLMQKRDNPSAKAISEKSHDHLTSKRRRDVTPNARPSAENTSRVVSPVADDKGGTSTTTKMDAMFNLNSY